MPIRQPIDTKRNPEIAALSELVANEAKKPSKTTMKTTSSAKCSKRESYKADSKKTIKPKRK